MASKLCRRVLLSVLMLLTLTACSNRPLTKIERVLETDVQSADSMLNSIEPPASGRSLALYSLLKTQIDYKLYRDIPTDSVIRIATDFYGTKRKDYHAAMSWYSLGCISGEFGQDSTAADAYLTALRMFPDTLVRYYALTEQNLSYIYLRHDLLDEAIQMINKCIINANRLKDSAAIAFCELNVANSLLYRKQFSEAQGMFLKLMDSQWLSDDAKDLPFIQLSKISQHHDIDYKKSLEYIDSFIIKNQHRVPYGTAYSIKADAYYGLNMIDSAQLYYELSLTDVTDPFTICDTYRRLSEIHSFKGNKDSATYYIKQSSMWMDSTITAYNPNDIYKTIINNRNQSLSSRLKSPDYFASPHIVIIIGILLVGTLLHLARNRKSHKEVQDFQMMIETFKNGELYGTMCEIVKTSGIPIESRRTEIENDFHSSLQGLRSYLKSSGNKLNEMDIDYCLFTMLGFKQKDFHLFFPITPSGTSRS